MKIIDNKKDYYDYLVGTYGIDEKMVYDRRGSVRIYNGVLKSGFTVINESDITNLIIRVGHLVYYINKNKNGEWEMPEKVTSLKNYYTPVDNPIRITDDEINRFVPFKIEWKGSNYNMKYDDATPVSATIIYNYMRSQNKLIVANPILASLPAVVKFIPADTAWQEIYNFISSQYDKDIIDNRSDIQKLESAGFDKKTSFRNVK